MNTTANDATPALSQLRATFPAWGFLHEPATRRWFAVRAHHPTITTYSPEELARQVGNYELAASRPTTTPRR